MASYARTVTLTEAALKWVEHTQLTKRTPSFSATVSDIITEHRTLSPSIRYQKAIDQLRSAAAYLSQDADIEPDAIQAWVAAVIGGGKSA